METVITPENYEENRRSLVEANANLLGVILREKEQRADEILTSLKEELRLACGGNIPYDIPVLTDKRLTQSRLYRFCSRLPKGADLHVHDVSLLPACELIELLATMPEFCINADHRSYDLRVVEEGQPAPDGYLFFSEAYLGGEFSKEELIKNWTVSGAASSGRTIWDYFENLFARQAVLSDNPAFAAKYYDYTFRYYCRKNIMHVEIHLMLTESMDASAAYLRVIRQAYYNVKRDYPYFTVRVIGAGVKDDSDDFEMTKTCLLNTSYVQEIIKDESDPDHPRDFIIGFDLVNEEDASLPLHAFAPMLLKVKKNFPDLRFYIHGGESLAAGNENLIDAYLLGADRVGHGLNLYRYPDLHSRYVRAEICLEICPISNQTLGYTADIRNHPATEYLRTGVAVALCSDDPAYMENETLTDDFFAAVVGWDLGLAELKQLGINSIQYSGLGKEEKIASMKAYRALWDSFVDELLEKGI